MLTFLISSPLLLFVAIALPTILILLVLFVF